MFGTELLGTIGKAHWRVSESGEGGWVKVFVCLLFVSVLLKLLKSLPPISPVLFPLYENSDQDYAV